MDRSLWGSHRGELRIVNFARESFTTGDAGPNRCAALRTAWTGEGARPHTTLSAHPLWAGLGHVGLFWGSYLEQRLAPDMHKAQFARREQGVDCFFHARSWDEVCEEVFDLSLIYGDHAVQIFRDQSRERFGHRNADALAHNIWRPARQLIPHRAFLHRVIHARDAQFGPQFAQPAIEPGVRKRTAQHLAQFGFRNGPTAAGDLESVRGHGGGARRRPRGGARFKKRARPAANREHAARWRAAASGCARPRAHKNKETQRRPARMRCSRQIAEPRKLPCRAGRAPSTRSPLWHADRRRRAGA